LRAFSTTTEPSVSGLWQKIDGETGKPVGSFLFLFVERNGLYEGVIAKLFPRQGGMTARRSRCIACSVLDMKPQWLVPLGRQISSIRATAISTAQ
jgi:hypothetical protein